jgi:hypothetical protein
LKVMYVREKCIGTEATSVLQQYGTHALRSRTHYSLAHFLDSYSNIGAHRRLRCIFRPCRLTHLQFIVSPSRRPTVTERRGRCGEATASHKTENDGRYCKKNSAKGKSARARSLSIGAGGNGHGGIDESEVDSVDQDRVMNNN